MSEKISGYLLLLFGLILILYPALNVYQVFTHQIPLISFFRLPAVQMTVPNLGAVELFPAESITESANLAAHLILMGFLTSVGYKISSLGVQLLRPIVVKLRDKQL